jgi:Glutamine synthetase N-terminal domain
VIGEPLTGFLHCDLVGIVRGRLLAAADVEARLTSGVGWVPANISLTPFGGIAEPNPHGSTGFRSQPPHHPEFLPPDDAVTMVARAQAALYLAAANR